MPDSVEVASSLPKILKTHFGFDAFRPNQEKIIQALLAGRDVFATMPTGGGKSLCFQLPALVKGGLTLVISPLIALMKDQVDSLQTNGIPATFINSSLTAEEIAARFAALQKGEFRLLYAAPERVMTPVFLEKLKTWPIILIAIDEAHCISEWGHDFRPEYRQLSQLRMEFPKVPLLAVTATATQRVQADIKRQLHLNHPDEVIASFNRPNLTYRVLPKHKSFQQLTAFLKDHADESGIIYCLSRKTCDELADKLSKEGLSAKPYHAGLDASVRTKNQDSFLRDDVRIMCATVAFGMGVHKSNVRFVVHYNLPRNLEGYYQETGRAGRDGLPSDCLMLYSSADGAKLANFIQEKSDEKERRLAHEQLQGMMNYAESAECRRKILLSYFGEEWNEAPCDGCDNCLSPRESFDATTSAQKLLSCVYRVKENGGFSTGLHHVVDILLGKETEKVLKWRHHQISTFGIGNELKRSAWITLGQELLQKKYLSYSEGEFKTIVLTSQGWDALKNRIKIELTKPLSSLKPQRSSNKDGSYDETLFEALRGLRKKLADERGVPAYIVFSDASLRDMANKRPTTLEQFGEVHGVGTKKRDEFGPLFTQFLKNF